MSRTLYSLFVVIGFAVIASPIYAQERQSNQTDIFEIRRSDSYNVIYLKRPTANELPTSAIEYGRKTYIVFPLDILAREYSLETRLEHVKNIIVSWSKASNSRILYCYKLSKLSDHHVPMLFAPEKEATSVLYATRRLIAEKYFYSVPVLVKGHSRQPASLAELTKVLESAIEWAAGDGKLAEMEKDNFVLSNNLIADLNPRPFLILGDARWNVYIDADQALRKVAAY